MTSRQLRRIMCGGARRSGQTRWTIRFPPTFEASTAFRICEPAFSAFISQLPDDDIDELNRRASPYHRRLIFEEFFLLELVFALRRKQSQLARGVRFETNDRDPQQREEDPAVPSHCGAEAGSEGNRR